MKFGFSFFFLSKLDFRSVIFFIYFSLSFCRYSSFSPVFAKPVLLFIFILILFTSFSVANRRLFAKILLNTKRHLLLFYLLLVFFFHVPCWSIFQAVVFTTIFSVPFPLSFVTFRGTILFHFLPPLFFFHFVSIGLYTCPTLFHFGFYFSSPRTCVHVCSYYTLSFLQLHTLFFWLLFRQPLLCLFYRRKFHRCTSLAVSNRRCLLRNASTFLLFVVFASFL